MTAKNYIEIDRGWKRIKRQYAAGAKAFTKAGIPENAVDAKGEKIAIRAIANEYGTDTIPERPFMRKAFDENRENLMALERKLFSDVLRGRISASECLRRIGEAQAECIKKSIRDFDNPPNADSTIEQKGKDDPLIDTGAMLDAVTHIEGKE